MLLEGLRGGCRLLSLYSGRDLNHLRATFNMVYLAALGSSQEGGRIWGQESSNNVPGPSVDGSGKGLGLRPGTCHRNGKEG